MGGALSAVVDLIVMAVDLSAATGITMESILTGEALAALEAEVTSVMTIQGLSGLEALAQLGWTAEQFSQMSFLATTFSQALGYGVMLQTVTGVSALISVGLRLGLEVAAANREMEVAELSRVLGTLAQTLHINLSHQFNPLDWCGSLHDNYPHLHGKVDQKVLSSFAQVIEMGRWVRQHDFTTNPQEESGDIIVFYGAPGGAMQSHTPDWLLHLILRLHGSEEKTPSCSNLSSWN
ncbi:minor capsid protein VP2 [Myotis davidii polyomavirus 1]|nr:minor capsid protein VP2 [Myotis davidii polyomavirus 1]